MSKQRKLPKLFLCRCGEKPVVCRINVVCWHVICPNCQLTTDSLVRNTIELDLLSKEMAIEFWNENILITPKNVEWYEESLKNKIHFLEHLKFQHHVLQEKISKYEKEIEALSHQIPTLSKK